MRMDDKKRDGHGCAFFFLNGKTNKKTTNKRNLQKNCVNFEQLNV